MENYNNIDEETLAAKQAAQAVFEQIQNTGAATRAKINNVAIACLLINPTRKSKAVEKFTYWLLDFMAPNDTPADDMQKIHKPLLEFALYNIDIFYLARVIIENVITEIRETPSCIESKYGHSLQDFTVIALLESEGIKTQ